MDDFRNRLFLNPDFLISQQPTHRRQRHTTSHINTYQHAHKHTAQTHHTHQAHFSFQHRYRPTSFQVARGLHRNPETIVSCMMRTCQTNKEWAMADAVWPSGKVGTCAQREPTVGMLIVIVIERVIERERKRETHERKRETRERHERERHKKRGRARREVERGSDYLQNATACTFKTLPSVRSKNPRVLYDTGVFNVHTGAFFSARQEETHKAHTQSTHNTQRHVKREPDEKRER